MAWIDAMPVSAVDTDDMCRFDHGGTTFVIYRTSSNEFYCTEGLCTHQRVHLSGGLLLDYEVECPKHNGRFDIRTGQAKCRPVSLPLKTYPVRVENGRVVIDLPDV